MAQALAESADFGQDWIESDSPLAFDGLTAAETGHKLECSERTVNYYLSNAMRKLGVDNKLAAVERAIWYGVI